MQEVTPPGVLSPRAAFVVSAISLVAVFMAAGTPIPLYNLYRSEDGLTNAHLGLITVGYLGAAGVALLMLGRLSNFLGRKPVALGTIGLSLAACVLLMTFRGPLPLFVERLLQGLSSGVASSALGAYVVDTSRNRPAWLPAAITGSAPMVGIPAGALLCGALVQYAPAPKVMVFAILAIVLLACGILVALCPETMPRRKGVLATLRPHLQVPAGSGRLVLAAGSASVATWSIGGFFQAFGPSVVAKDLGTSNALAVAAVFSSVMILTPIGGPLAARLSPAAGLRVGMILFLCALAGIVSSLYAGAILPFVLSSLLVGLSIGISSTGGIRALLAKAAQHERAGLLSTLYLIAYAGSALPGLVAGRLTAIFDLRQIVLGYAAIGVVGAVTAILAARNPGEGRPG